ncbi:MAG: hypothetical protein LBQ58_05685, partial [Synergistaceae bacterium]|nr:hypothetical protein [Synergistaceae bacterium]
KRPEGQDAIRDISADMESLYRKAAPDEGHMECITEADLKSRMRENRKYGSVRGAEVSDMG